MDTITSDEVKSHGYTQAYIELLKTGQNGLWFNSEINGSIVGSEYEVDITTLSGQFYNYLSLVSIGDTIYVVPPLSKESSNWSGKFAAGLDLRLSAKQVVSGIDTNGLLVRLNTNFNKDNLNKMVNAVADIYCEHDAFVQIIPGVATTVTF
jgi:hypothetical protein